MRKEKKKLILTWSTGGEGMMEEGGQQREAYEDIGKETKKNGRKGRKENREGDK